MHPPTDRLPDNPTPTIRIAENYVRPPTPLSFIRSEDGEVMVTFDGKEFGEFARTNPDVKFYVKQEDGTLFDGAISVPLYWETQRNNM